MGTYLVVLAHLAGLAQQATNVSPSWNEERCTYQTIATQSRDLSELQALRHDDQEILHGTAFCSSSSTHGYGEQMSCGNALPCGGKQDSLQDLKHAGDFIEPSM